MGFSTTGAATDFILFALSRPVPGGRTFWKTFTQVKELAGNAITGTLTTALYAAQFGTPVVGNNVFCRLTPVSQYGVAGVPLIFPMRVTA